MSATTPYPLRISEELRKNVKEAARVTSLPFPEVMRQSMELGLPVLKKKLAKPV